jgi:hypothetical protein
MLLPKLGHYKFVLRGLTCGGNRRSVSERERSMKTAASRLVAVAMLLAGFVVASEVQAGTMAYPNTQHPSFMVDLPEHWEMAQAEGEGDFVHVNGPNGVYLAFRTIPGDAGAMMEAIEDTENYLKENYKNVKLGNPVTAKQRGLEGFYMDGSGSDKEDGSAVTFRAVWLALKDGKIGEIWFAAPTADTQEIAAAAKVLNSFRAP